MSIRHHLDDSTLLSFVAGSLPEPLSAVAATHITLCEQCAREAKKLERVGAALLEMLPKSNAGVAPKLPDNLMMAGHNDTSNHHRQSEVVTRPNVCLPDEVHELLTGCDSERLAWKRLGFGVWHIPLKHSDNAEGQLRLLKVAPGRVMPEHGHNGSELTLLLDGAYQDETGEYRTGDVADLGDEVEHKPIADPVEGCVCLVASDSKARFTGLIGKMVQPFIGM